MFIKKTEVCKLCKQKKLFTYRNITKEVRTADVIAKGPVEVLKVDDSCLNNIKSHYPKIGAKIFYNISRILSQRLKETTKEWAKTH